MPSPFPGIDPFIEGPAWESFRASFACAIADALNATLPLDYVARVVVRRFEDQVSYRGSRSLGEFREAYVNVVSIEPREVATVIDFMSPIGKQRGTNGRRIYRAHRDSILNGRVNFVEIDLLRGGKPFGTTPSCAPGAYVVLVSRSHRRPNADSYQWSLRDRMPVVPIPLRSGNAVSVLDLQAAFDLRYDVGRYDRSLDYKRTLDPMPSTGDASWIAERLLAWRAA